MRYLLLAVISALIGFSHGVIGDTVKLGDEFELKPGQEVQIQGGPTVTFIEVPSDSRCPEDVTCVWQGNAEVVLQIKRAKKQIVTATVNTGIDPMETEYRQFKIRLVRLMPALRSDVRIDRSSYRATLVVKRKGEK